MFFILEKKHKDELWINLGEKLDVDISKPPPYDFPGVVCIIAVIIHVLMCM